MPENDPQKKERWKCNNPKSSAYGIVTIVSVDELNMFENQRPDNCFVYFIYKNIEDLPKNYNKIYVENQLISHRTKISFLENFEFLEKEELFVVKDEKINRFNKIINE